MSDQEASNLRTYAQDIATVQGASGNRLRLDITFAYLGAADYTIGSPTTGLGYDRNVSATEFIARVATTTDKVVSAVRDVTRPDGVRVVGTIFFKGEVLVPAPGEPNGNPNEGWFLTNNYPRFVSVVSAAGLQPSVYFAVDGHQYAVFDNSFVDSYYQIVNGHRSMFWVYRALRFMVDHGLPVPPRIELSCYLEQGSAPYDQVLQRILDDADATLPTLGGTTHVWGCRDVLSGRLDRAPSVWSGVRHSSCAELTPAASGLLDNARSSERGRTGRCLPLHDRRLLAASPVIGRPVNREDIFMR
jgi:hypothetical protein